MNDLILSRYLPLLERVLTPNRLQHSLGVMQVMGELAAIYDLDQERALTAGLLHDAAKDLSDSEIQGIVAKAGITIDEPCEQDYGLYLHGPVGAYFARTAFGVTDPLILDAIVRHTWVGPMDGFESVLVWCLRFADILEPNRRWDDAARKIRENEPRLRESVYAGNLREAAKIQTETLIAFFQDTKKPIHSNYYRVNQQILTQGGRIDDRTGPDQ